MDLLNKVRVGNIDGDVQNLQGKILVWIWWKLSKRCLAPVRWGKASDEKEWSKIE